MGKYRWIVLFFGLLISCGGGADVDKQSADSGDWAVKARQAMVENQIQARGIEDLRVLEAMGTVPRHCFVPEASRKEAYDDRPLPIGNDQTISQPYIVAFMTQALKLGNKDRVLEIGTGSGYQAAVLSQIVAEVYTIEIIESLARSATALFQTLEYQNIHTRVGDGALGWPGQAPFDAIILTAAPPRVPESLIAQLKVGGRMILPVGEWYQELVLIEKLETDIRQTRLIPVRFVPMTGRVQGEG